MTARLILKTVSFLGLALTLVPAFLVFSEIIEFPLHRHLMLVGTVLWFATRPFWMGKDDSGVSDLPI